MSIIYGTKIDLGTGKLQLATNGKFNAEYKMTIPKELEDYELIEVTYIVFDGLLYCFRRITILVMTDKQYGNDLKQKAIKILTVASASGGQKV